MCLLYKMDTVRRPSTYIRPYLLFNSSYINYSTPISIAHCFPSALLVSPFDKEMALLKSFSLLFFFLLLSFSLSIQLSHMASASSHDANKSNDLVRQSCVHARYPTLCLRTLSSAGASAKTPADLAQAAVSVSLSHARNATTFLSSIWGGTSVAGSKREKGAVKDCVEQLSDSVDQLRRTLSELRELQPGTFRWQMSNVETWVSAALTNEDTCLDGFQGVDGAVKSAVKKKILNVARLTSNALYLINRLASTRP